MASSKKELFADDLDDITGGAAKNTTTNNTVGGINNKSAIQGKEVSVKNSKFHMGNSISQINNVQGNKSNVKIDKPTIIENAGSGNVYHL